MPTSEDKSRQRVTFLFWRWLFVLAVVIGPVHSAAQVLPFEPYTVKNGLLSNDILFITQDSEGYLWIGTRDGVSIFDGQEFTNITSRDGLPSSVIWAVAEDRSSRSKIVWLLGANGKLSKWFHGRCVPFDYDSILSRTGNITSLCVEASGILWAGTEDTLIQIVHDRIRPVRTGTPVRFPHLIKEQGDSVLWIASRSGLVRYVAATGIFTKVSLGRFEGDVVNALIFDDDGSAWVGVKDGYIIRIEHSKIAGSRKVGPFGFLVKDKRGTFWFGNYGGLNRIRNPLLPSSRIEHMTMESGLSENTLREGFVDREGNLWFGGITQGLVKLTDDRVVRFPMGDINPPYQYSVAGSDSSSHIWLIARSGLWEFWRAEGGQWHQAKHADLSGKGTASAFPVFDILPAGESEVKPYALFCARDDMLWIVFSNAQIVAYEIRAAKQGPSQLRPVRVLRAGQEVPHEFPRPMIVDHRGLLWYSLGNSILMLDTRGRLPLLRSFRETPMGISYDYARVVFEDRSGSIWAGFLDGGVMRLDADSLQRGAFHSVHVSDETVDGAVAAICQDSLGQVWVATEGGGLLVGNGDGMKHLSVSQGLPSNTVLSLTADPNGRIWVGSSNGISYIDGANPSASVQPSIFFGEYCVQSGITSDSTRWFVARSGLLLYRAGDDEAHVPSPVPCIRSFQVNGKDVDPEREQQLLYDENTCVVGFVAPTFRDPALLRYSFRVTNGDTNWSLPQRQGHVTFAALPPGEYRFEVRAHLIGSPSPSRSAFLRFSIASPFWRTWWFTSAVALVLMGTIAGSIRYFEKRKVLARMRLLELQQVLNQERLRISDDMHDEIGSALTEISILGELGRQADSSSTQMKQKMEEMAEKSREVLDSIAEIIWAINPRNDELDNFAAYVRRFSLRFCDQAGIRCRVDIPEDLPDVRLSAEQRRNLFLIVKESLNNVVKHAGATEIVIRLTIDHDDMMLEIADNGGGFDAGAVKDGGSGLLSMRHRAEEIGGTFSLISTPGGGTRVSVYLKCGIAEKTTIR